MDEPTTISVRIPARMVARWQSLLAGRGHGKLEFTVRDGEINFVRLEETTAVQATELRSRKS